MNRRLQSGFPARQPQPGEPLAPLPDASMGLRLQLVGEEASIARGAAGRRNLDAMLADTRTRLLAECCEPQEKEARHDYRAH
jgi:hypothetical protein